MRALKNKILPHLARKSAIQLLKTQLIISSSLVLLTAIARCASNPISPNDAKAGITMCVLDAPANEAICGSKYNEISRVPILDLDKGIAFSQDDWERVQNYIDFLEVFHKECLHECNQEP